MGQQFTDVTDVISSLEDEKEIDIIAAWDRGSRAWGLDTEESDRDISFFYTQPEINHQLLDCRIESIDTNGTILKDIDFERYELDPSDYELSGWDVQRFMGFVLESNPIALEGIHSPLFYIEPSHLDELREYTNAHFDYIGMYKKYESTAEDNLRKYFENNSQPTVKKYLIIVRAIMCAEYIRETHRIPPMNFYTLLDELPDSKFLPEKSAIKTLVNDKMNGNKNKQIEPDGVVYDFLDYELDYQSHIQEKNMQSDKLNELFRKIL